MGIPLLARCPTSHPFLWESSPTKIDYIKKVSTLILTSLLKDLDLGSGPKDSGKRNLDGAFCGFPPVFSRGWSFVKGRFLARLSTPQKWFHVFGLGLGKWVWIGIRDMSLFLLICQRCVQMATQPWNISTTSKGACLWLWMKKRLLPMLTLPSTPLTRNLTGESSKSMSADKAPSGGFHGRLAYRQLTWFRCRPIRVGTLE